MEFAIEVTYNSRQFWIGETRSGIFVTGSVSLFLVHRNNAKLYKNETEANDVADSIKMSGVMETNVHKIK